MPYEFCSGATTGIVGGVTPLLGCVFTYATVEMIAPIAPSAEVVSGDGLFAADPGVAKLALP